MKSIPEIGEAFGVRRPGAAFPALHFANDPLKSGDTFSDSKAGKAAPGRRTPKASPASCDLISADAWFSVSRKGREIPVNMFRKLVCEHYRPGVRARSSGVRNRSILFSATVPLNQFRSFPGSCSL